MVGWHVGVLFLVMPSINVLMKQKEEVEFILKVSFVHLTLFLL